MDLNALKEQVWRANLLLPRYDLVVFTWGNVSAVDREQGLMVIKPSGVAYEELRPQDMVAVDLKTGCPVDSGFRPSSDTMTHLTLYRAFPSLGGIVHTHSRWATSFAQAGRSIEPMGTTHADHFYGSIPCTRPMSPPEICHDLEEKTGSVIIETIAGRDPLEVPAVLVHGHGPFTWGAGPEDAVRNAVVLEQVAFMNFHAMQLAPDASPISQALLDKHYLRKHGPGAYYGQP